jgi:4-amino-4-deoxy-L-arabinose transferase-like glycosyltransferase
MAHAAWGIRYLDVWDHKPPVIFLINALGLLIGGGSRWGVWLVELGLLFLAALLGFKLIKRYLGALPAIFALFLWLLSLAFIINGGNLTTEYTLAI